MDHPVCDFAKHVMQVGLAGTGSKDIGIFRYAADGTRPWGDTVRPLVIAARDQVDVQVVADGRGGILGLAMVSLLHVNPGARLSFAADAPPVVDLLDKVA